MQSDKPSLSSDFLRSRRFDLACQWQISDGQLNRPIAVPNDHGVYAFALDGIVQYVGLAAIGLAKRVAMYARPGATQATNIRLNALICDLVSAGKTVEIYVATPPDFEWNGWVVRGAEGLEAGLIKHYHLPWNVRGASGTPAKGTTGASIDSKAIQRRPAAGSAAHGGKYGPLQAHLERTASDRISMTFAQIEALVGKLPKSASLHQAWWGNHDGNSQAQAWMGARYLVEANPKGRSVIFRKFTT